MDTLPRPLNFAYEVQLLRRVRKLSQEVHSCCAFHNMLCLRDLATALSGTQTAYLYIVNAVRLLLAERPAVDSPSGVRADVAGDRGSPFSPDAPVAAVRGSRAAGRAA